MSLKELAKQSGNAIAIHYVALDDLTDTFLKGNSKRHDTAKLIDSIQRYGFRDPIAFDSTLNNSAGGIIEGNGRLAALLEMRDQDMNLPKGIINNWHVPVLFGVDATSEAEAVSFSVEHNWSVLWGVDDLDLDLATSMFDEEALKEQLGWLDAENSLPLSIDDNLDDLLDRLDEGGTERANSEIIEDEIPEDVETRVKLGDVWVLGKHRLYCGDSTNEEKVKEFLGDHTPTFIWSDPPYGIEIVSGKGAVGGGNCNRTPIEQCIAKKEQRLGSKKNNVRSSDGGSNIIKVNEYFPIIGDDSINTAINSFSLCIKLAPKSLQIWWGGNYYANSLENSSCWIVWDKDNTGNFADAELAWTNSKTAVRIFKHRWNGMLKDSEKTEKRVHPTQKPVALFVWCCDRYGKPNDFIFDPFLGSGISIIGAEQMNDEKVVYGCELSKHYCDVILTRWENLTGETAVFEKNIN